MHFIHFRSDIPLDHLSRGLDELRRVGFELCAVSVSVDEPRPQMQGEPARGAAEIRIGFRPQGALTPQLLFDRIARMEGVHDLGARGPAAA